MREIAKEVKEGSNKTLEELKEFTHGDTVELYRDSSSNKTLEELKDSEKQKYKIKSQNLLKISLRSFKKFFKCSLFTCGIITILIYPL